MFVRKNNIQLVKATENFGYMILHLPQYIKLSVRKPHNQVDRIINMLAIRLHRSNGKQNLKQSNTGKRRGYTSTRSKSLIYHAAAAAVAVDGVAVVATEPIENCYQTRTRCLIGYTGWGMNAASGVLLG